jgi:hypothetical protein
VVRPDDPRTAGLLRMVGHLVEAIPHLPTQPGDRSTDAVVERQGDAGLVPDKPVKSVRAKKAEGGSPGDAGPKAAARKTPPRRAKA